MLKPIIKNLIAKLGYEIKDLRYKPFGIDLRWDLKNIFKLNGTKPTAIMDIGAHTGETAIFFKELFPDALIYSFEPASQSFEKLTENLRGIKNIKTFKIALGPENLQKPLFLYKEEVNNSFLAFKGVDAIGEEAVDVVRLDTFCQQNSIERVDILKTDAEGYDLEVLKGAVRLFEESKVALVYAEVCFCETHQGQALFEDILLFLRRYNFGLFGLYGSYYHERKFMTWSNALFLNPSSFNC